jgi:hypothetical protein
MSKTTIFLPPRLLCGLGAVLTVALSGCGTGDVSGTVRFNGKPLPGGRVTFTSLEKKGKFVFASIREDGSYLIENCPTGPVRITVQTVVLRSGVVPAGKKPGPGGRSVPVILPVRYADPEQSGLDYLVSRGQQQHDINLEPDSPPK